MNAVFTQFKNLWAKLSVGQRIGGAGAVFALIVVIGFAMTLGGSIEYRSLASGIERGEAQKILAKLDEAEIPYRLQDGGRSIDVAAPRWDEVQRVLVRNNLMAGSSAKGYSGLGDIPFGRTEAQLKLELRKAQEEQIALTLQHFDNVEEAVVHLTPGARGLSQKDQRPAKASVMLRTKPGRMLPSSEVEAVVQLVAHAVDGLDAEHVVVTDFRGILLARPEGAGQAALPGILRTREVEIHLQEKAESALVLALGPDKAVVRVDAELDLERVDTTKRIVDPESKVIMSETSRSSTNASVAAKGTAGARAATDGSAQPANGTQTEDTQATYRYGESEVRTTKEIGKVKRLTIGVLVDEALKEKQQSIEGMVKGAVGFTPARDLFQLAFVPFAPPKPASAPVEPGLMDSGLVFEIVRWVITAAVGFGLLWFVLRSTRGAKASLRAALERTHQETQTQTVLAQRTDPRDEFRRLVDENTETVGKLLRNWLYEPVKR